MFLSFIILGGLLLALPISSKSGEPTIFIDALFTAGSASCVTGLTVYNTAKHWSLFGKVVIILLIQIGGLGIMTFATIFSLLVRKKIGIRERVILGEEHGIDTMTGIVRILKYVMGFTFTVEAVGAVFLSSQFIPLYGFKKGLWYSIFHAVSAFCNAGFDILGDSIYPFRSNLIINFTIMALVVIGGLGFLVNQEILTWKKHPRISSHTKLVITMTIGLVFVGAILFWILENSNPATMGQENLGVQILQSFFQSVIARTAGFYSLDFSSIRESTGFLFMMLMFIGASPGSTGGGLKTTTFAVLIASTYSTIKGEETVIFKRKIPSNIISKALALIVICLAIVLLITFAITVFDKFNFYSVLFETISAFATVGNTLGITGELENFSKFLLTITMYIGRIGPLTLAYAISQKQNKTHIKYPEANISVG